MSHRAAIVLLQDGMIALIERYKNGDHYFTFPGGHVEAGESPEKAAIRETKEELGLEVVIQKEFARMRWRGNWQQYYLVEARGGNFGDQQGPEMQRSVQESGSYQPTWVPVGELLAIPLRPRQVAELVEKNLRKGWPEGPVELVEE